MSNFLCPVCGVDQIDSTQGYVEGCIHYGTTIGGEHEVEFGDGVWVDAVTDGVCWSYSQEAISKGECIHPKRWRLKKQQ